MNNVSIFNRFGNNQRRLILSKINYDLINKGVAPVKQDFKYLSHLLQETKAFHTLHRKAGYACQDYSKTLKKSYEREYAYTYARSLLYGGIPTYSIQLSMGRKLEIENTIRRIIQETRLDN